MSDHLSAVLFLFSVLYMGKYISRITAQETPVLLAVIREFEEELRILIGSLEERRAVEVPLGKERRGFSRVAGLGTSLDPAAFLHI